MKNFEGGYDIPKVPTTWVAYIFFLYMVTIKPFLAKHTSSGAREYFKVGLEEKSNQLS